MPNRSLIKQSKQVRGSETFFSTINMAYGEQAGREYASETFTVTSGVNTISCTGALNNTEVDNYIVISSGTAAGVYEITAVSGTVATVTPTPTGTDASASGNKHYFKNIEDDLNYIRNNIKNITGETNWYDTPSSDIATLASGGGGVENHSELNELDYASSGHTGFASSADLSATSGTLQSQITNNTNDITQNTWDISVVSGTTVMTPVEVTTSTHTASSNTIININYDGNVTVTLPNPNLTWYEHERIIINDVSGYFANNKLTVNVADSQNVLTKSNDWQWFSSLTFSGRYFSYEFTRTSAYSWQLTNGEGIYRAISLSYTPYTAKSWDEIYVNTTSMVINLPPGYGAGNRVRIIDANNSFSTTPCTVNGNGHNIFVKNDGSFKSSVSLTTLNGIYDFYFGDSNVWYFSDNTISYTHIALSSNTTLYYGSRIISADTSGGSFYISFDGAGWSDGLQAIITDVKGTFSTNNLQITTANVFGGPGITGTSAYLDIDYGTYVITYDKTNSVFIVDTPYNTNDILTVSGSLQNQIDGIEFLPTQSGNSGKFLTTDGTLASWATIGNDVDMTYVSGTGVWTYDGSFSSVPDSLAVFCNGIKQRRNDSSYYVASTVSGVLNINFGFSTDIDDWVNITYNS